jgi:hypothetical protein
MSIEIVHESYVEDFEEFSLSFEYPDSPGAGFSFPCDKEGNPDWDHFDDPRYAAARENLDKCLLGKYDVVFKGVERRSWSYRHPRVGRCHCGEEVTLDRFTNTCYICGTDYNSAGQELAPREQWGEETGEHWSDCI